MESEDDFEYHISFPVSDYSNVLEDNEKEPVVVLLGWAGCLDKHLAKYSAIYEKEGYITVRYIAPIKKLFSPEHHSKIRSYAARLLELLCDMNLNDHTIFFHMFSNGGALVYDFLQELIDERPELKIKVGGCIFDSTPAQVSLMQFLKAVYLATRGSLLWRLVVVVVALLRMVAVHMAVVTRPRDLWQSLAREPNRAPQLFLYSRGDDICSAASIEKFIDLRRELGVSLLTQCWEDSPHVQHYLYHPQEYSHQVLSFLSSHNTGDHCKDL